MSYKIYDLFVVDFGWVMKVHLTLVQKIRARQDVKSEFKFTENKLKIMKLKNDAPLKNWMTGSNYPNFYVEDLLIAQCSTFSY